MSPTHKHFAIQILILIVWAVFLTSTEKADAVEPASCPTEMHFLAPPPLKSWPWNSNVNVKIDSTFIPTDRSAIENGVIKWNGLQSRVAGHAEGGHRQARKQPFQTH
jgi:hypothetical protein